MDDIVKKILSYYSVGYSQEEILNEMKSELGINEEANYRIVQTTIHKAQQTMSDEEKQKIQELKKIRKDQIRYNKMIEIADQVKNKVFENTAVKKDSDKYLEAVSFVAKNNGLTTGTVKNYTKLVYPCFYDNCVNNSFMDDKYYVDMARKIIDNKMLKTHCAQMMGFEAMMSYLEKHRPELFAELNKSFAEASAKFNIPYVEFSKSIYNITNKNLLIEIILKFRVPFKVVCEFLTNNPTFMRVDSINEDEFIKTFRGHAETRGAVEWYFAEMMNYSNPDCYDEYVNYRILKFNEFVKKFNLVKNDPEKLSKLVRYETNINLSEIKRKIANHEPNRNYGFDRVDKKNIIDFMYRYGLGEQDVQKILDIPRISRTTVVSEFVPENIEEEMLVSGYNALTEYKNDVAYAFRVGRK